MNILYGARLARWDLLNIVQLLASRVNKWSDGCDRALHRLMCYIHHTSDRVLRGYVGGKADSVSLRLYADADFAGDRPKFKSTSGVLLALIDDNTCFPLCAKSAKHTCVAHSTVEAEMVAANTAVRTVGIPSLGVWESALKRHAVLNLIEDNESTYQIIKIRKNPTMRHLTRTHGSASTCLCCTTCGKGRSSGSPTPALKLNVQTSSLRRSATLPHGKEP